MANFPPTLLPKGHLAVVVMKRIFPRQPFLSFHASLGFAQGTNALAGREGGHFQAKSTLPSALGYFAHPRPPFLPWTEPVAFKEVIIWVLDLPSASTPVLVTTPQGKPTVLPPEGFALPRFLQKALDYGYDQSLMGRLCRHLKLQVQENQMGRLPVLQLTTQYRMHPDIWLFPAKYIYEAAVITDECVALVVVFCPRPNSSGEAGKGGLLS